MNTAVQQPLFVYVPEICGSKIKETASTSAQPTETAEESTSSMILPELLDKIHQDYVASCSPGLLKKFNGRLERALERAKLGNVSVTQEPGVFHVKAVTGRYIAFYVVDLNNKTCECKDHANGNTCYHRVAAWYIQQALFQTSENEPAIADEIAQEVVEALNPSPDVFIWGEYLYNDGSSIPVEILELDTEKMTACVRALPISDEGELSPIFPFHSPFEGSTIRWSSTACAFDELINVKIYRYKEA